MKLEERIIKTELILYVSEEDVLVFNEISLAQRISQLIVEAKRSHKTIKQISMPYFKDVCGLAVVYRGEPEHFLD